MQAYIRTAASKRIAFSCKEPCNPDRSIALYTIHSGHMDVWDLGSMILDTMIAAYYGPAEEDGLEDAIPWLLVSCAIP